MGCGEGLRLARVAPREGLRIEIVYPSQKPPLSGQATSLSLLSVRSAKPKHPRELLQSERALPSGAENMPFENPIPQPLTPMLYQ